MTSYDHQTLREKDHQMLLGLVESQKQTQESIREIKQDLRELKQTSLTKEELGDLRGLLEGGRAMGWLVRTLRSSATFITLMISVVLAMLTYFKWHTGGN